MENKSVNLSVLMDEFNAWDKYVVGIIQENKQLEQELGLAHKANDLTKEREQYLLKELKSARELVTSLQNTLNKHCDLEASEEKTILTRNLDEKNSQVLHLEKQLVDAEKEHQSDIMKLRMEKLQHQKAESEHEIANLKRTINQLQSKLDSQRHEFSVTNQGSGLSLNKRKRQ
ncbi:hypothetical protein LSH36_667g01039 [Paralvinella palmiformis]|uniref:Uncharacterized protein n=1 Tax=Paralvinella palmiformis TaxID=53620 RepID=A0AAD9J3U6_9ANNE|nr:hypothetical protein LSH36_667g01039 [Paralvinella palmiformis]